MRGRTALAALAVAVFGAGVANHVTKPAVTNKIAAREWGFVHLPHD